jgi:hypothetical protein
MMMVVVMVMMMVVVMVMIFSFGFASEEWAEETIVIKSVDGDCGDNKAKWINWHLRPPTVMSVSQYDMGSGTPRRFTKQRQRHYSTLPGPEWWMLKRMY